MQPDSDRLAAGHETHRIAKHHARLDPDPAGIEFELGAQIRAYLFDHQPVRIQPDSFVIDSMARIDGKGAPHHQQIEPVNGNTSQAP